MTCTISRISFSLATLLALALTTSGCTDLTPCKRGTEGCACDTSGGCEQSDEGRATCVLDTCAVIRPSDTETICFNACAYRADGVCDDGGPDATFTDCFIGTDCSDCGLRENPCAGTVNPVFCPQTPTQCWPSNIDCLSVRTCDALAAGMRGPFGCPSAQAIDCDAVGGAKCINTSSCQNMDIPQTPCVDELACVEAYIDCNTLQTCNGEPVACFTSETVVCTTGQAPSCQP